MNKPDLPEWLLESFFNEGVIKRITKFDKLDYFIKENKWKEGGYKTDLLQQFFWNIIYAKKRGEDYD